MLTDQQHPITPSPELVERLRSEAPHGLRDAGVTRERHLIFAAYRAGADQRLEACCQWLREAKHHGLGDEVGAMLAGRLRAAMRTKPTSLAEQALAELKEIMDELHEATGSGFTASAINAALKRLQELEQSNG